jgi:hypothetical protein
VGTLLPSSTDVRKKVSVERPEGIIIAPERSKASGLLFSINVHIAETIRMSSDYSQ